jgi:O-antigen/teichoic acid export membrane protein
MVGISGKIAFNVIANYLGQGWSALMAIAFLPVYIAELGFESFGLIGFFAVLQSALSVFDFGITATLTREAAQQSNGMRTAQSLRELVRSCELVCGASNIFIALIVWVLADRLASDWVNTRLLEPESVATSIALMSIVITTRLQEGIYRGVLLGMGMQVLLNIVIALLATVRYAGAVSVLLYGSPNIVTFFVWQVLVSLISLVVLAAFTYRRLPMTHQPQRFSIEALASIWRFSAGMAVVAGLSILMANLDRLILSGIIQLDEFGRYALAAAAASTLYLFAVPITQGFYPDMVGMYSRADRNGLTRLHHVSSQMVAVAAGSMAIIFIVFSKPILFVWSGNAVFANEISPIFSILAVAALSNCLGHVGHNLQIVTGATKGLAFTSIGAVLLMLFILPVAVANQGVAGAAKAWMVIATLQAAIVLYLPHRNCVQGEGLSWLLRDIIPPLTGAAATAWLFSYLIPQPEMGRLALAAFLVVAACSSFAAAMCLAPEVRARLKSIIRQKRSKPC